MANYRSNTLMPDSQGSGIKKISPESIHETLLAQANARLRSELIGSPLLLLVCILFVCLLSSSDLKEPWPAVIGTLIMAIPFVFALLVILIYFRHIKKINNAEYSIITDDVQRVVTDDKTKVERRFNRTTLTTEHAMYLYKCGRQVISLEQTYTISEGDIYYAVVYNDKPTVPLLLYNSKYYELEDVK